MLLCDQFQDATPAEIVALARLAQSPDMMPPPHLCPDLEAKGWVNRSDAGAYVLTAEALTLLDAFE